MKRIILISLLLISSAFAHLEGEEIDPLLGYKLTFILGIINIISLLLIFFSCKCLVGIKFLKRMWKYKIYRKYCKLHCYYWWIFLISVILHTILALITFGIPI